MLATSSRPPSSAGCSVSVGITVLPVLNVQIPKHDLAPPARPTPLFAARSRQESAFVTRVPSDFDAGGLWGT